jgi:hypothetical protein
LNSSTSFNGSAVFNNSVDLNSTIGNNNGTNLNNSSIFNTTRDFNNKTGSNVGDAILGSEDNNSRLFAVLLLGGCSVAGALLLLYLYRKCCRKISVLSKTSDGISHSSNQEAESKVEGQDFSSNDGLDIFGKPSAEETEAISTDDVVLTLDGSELGAKPMVSNNIQSFFHGSSARSDVAVSAAQSAVAVSTADVVFTLEGDDLEGRATSFSSPPVFYRVTGSMP